MARPVGASLAVAALDLLLVDDLVGRAGDLGLRPAGGLGVDRRAVDGEPGSRCRSSALTAFHIEPMNSSPSWNWVSVPEIAASRPCGSWPSSCACARRSAAGRARRARARRGEFGPGSHGASRCRARRPASSETSKTVNMCGMADRLRELIDVVLDSLDEPLDGAALAARGALLARPPGPAAGGGDGESPIALRRRLLLERAAWQLRTGAASASEAAAARGLRVAGGVLARVRAGVRRAAVAYAGAAALAAPTASTSTRRRGC